MLRNAFGTLYPRKHDERDTQTQGCQTPAVRRNTVMQTVKRIVFAGAGHAHLYALKRTASLIRAGCEVVLVAPERHLFYSGMATGVLSGHHPPDEALIDAAALVEGGGGRYLRGTVECVSPEERTLRLTSGESLGYDLASFATGSSTRVPSALEGIRADDLIPVKPVGNLLRLRERLLGGRERVVIVGGGAAGCEVAANAAALVGRVGLTQEITLVESEDRLLPDAPERAGGIIQNHLEAAGVTVMTGREVAPVAGSDSILSNGDVPGTGLVVVATGVRASGLFADSGLAVGGGGGMLVDEYLRYAGDEREAGRIFGGGDCISFGPEGLPGYGVYAIRQGPILFANLLAAVRGDRLRRFEPQSRNLYILGLGGGRGLGIYGRLVWEGRSAGRVKDLIDRRFVREYQS